MNRNPVMSRSIPVLMEIPDSLIGESVIAELKQIVEDLRREYCDLKTRAAPISFSEKELAAYFEISLITMERIRRDGKISYTRVGGKIHYTRAHVEEFLAATQTARKGKRQ